MFDGLAKLFRMSDAVWARHANPLSVWTRAPILPLFALAIWSRVWIGWWAVATVALLLIWTWANPRVFPPVPANTGWCYRAVSGEKFLTQRDRRPVPAHHNQMAWLLAILSTVSAVIMAWGLYHLALWPTLTGVAGAMMAKFWFLDRMAWLYEDMTRSS